MSTPFQPLPCAADSGGGEPGVDVEGTLVCDVNAAGEVVGTALVEAVYDETGARTGTRLVNVIDGTLYVPVGTVQPCREGCCPEPVILCDVQPDGSSVQFIRSYTGDETGAVESADTLLDGSPFVPTGTVGSCDPYRLCTPLSDVNLNGDCGPGETPNTVLIGAEGVATDSVVNDDPTADPLCGGVWDRPSEPSPFTVNESFRNATFDQPGPVTQGTAPYAGLTASPGWTGSNVDPAGQGWLQTSDINSFTNGIWQVPNPFSTADGMTAQVTFASHDGTITPNGDGMAFVFTDGSIPPQSTAVGGGGNLGLANWQGGYVAVVMDEYGGVCGGNSICLSRAGGSAVPPGTGFGSFASVSVAPHNISADTGRANPGKLITSIISEGGQTYVSASILWAGDTEPTVYFDRFNVTAAGLPPAPATLRMSLYGGSGGAFRSEHEFRDATAAAAGAQQWRAFPIVTDPIPACVTSVRVEACVDVTFTEDTQVTGNGNPEAFLWLVNTATNTVLDKVQRSSQPSQVGTSNTMCVDAVVPVAQLANLRVYVGAETRDPNGIYGSSWENLEITVAGLGCPVTPVRTLAISAPCPIDVNIIGGTADGTPAPVTVVNTPATFEDVAVCMVVAGVVTSGLRREVRAPDGSVTVSFLGADGVPVTPDTWVAGPCASPIFTGFVCDIIPGTPATPDQTFTDDFSTAVESGGGTSYTWANFGGSGLPVSVFPTLPSPLVGTGIQFGSANQAINYVLPAAATDIHIVATNFGTTNGDQMGFSPDPPIAVTGDGTIAAFVVNPTLPVGTADVTVGPASTFNINVPDANGGGGIIQTQIRFTIPGAAATAETSVPLKQFHLINDGVHVPSYTDMNGDPYTAVGSIGPCPDDCAPLVLGPVCVTSSSFPGAILPAVAVQDCTDDTVAYLNAATGVPWPGTVTVVVCPPDNQLTEEILCDAGTDPPTPFRRLYTLTALGSVLVADEDLAGTPYVAVGPVGVCAADCTSCQTLTLCDFGADVPVLITGISTGGTLSNGVTWSGARGSAANFNPQHNNADGSWWGMAAFPNSTVAPDTWFFDRPVDVEFSVVIAYSPATGSGLINQVQVPLGSELISSAADYSYDVATGIVTVDSSNSGDCTKVTGPTVAKSARFVLRNVTQFTLDFLGQRIAICGQFSNWRFGSIAVTPATTTFLRTICRDCDGAITTVTDTQADGTTPYIPIGPVGECGTQADAEPQCFATQICVQPQGVQEFISNAANLTSTVAVPNIDPVWQWSNDPVLGPWFNMYDVGVFPGWITVDPGTTQGVANWVAPHPDSSPNTSGLPGEGPTIGPGNAQWYARAQFTLPANADPASIKIAATVLNADQLGVEFRLNNGAWQPVNASHVDPPFSFPAQVIPGAQAGLNEVFVHVTETVFGSGAAGVKMHLIASYNLGDQQSWTQIVCDDGTVSYFTNAGEQTDALPQDWVIVPCGAGSACPCVDCTNASTLLVCDLPTGDPDGIPTVTNLGTQFIANTSNAVFQQRPGGGGALWTGGQVNFGPDVDPVLPGISQLHRYASATVQATPPSCTDGTATLAFSVQVQNIGPGAGCSGVGRFRLFKISDGSTLAAGSSPPINTPVGVLYTLTINANVSAADLSAGNIAVWLDLETWQTAGCPPPDSKAWQASNFTAAYAYGQEGCETQFFRTVVTDCETGETLATVDTTVDGAPYVVTGQVGECTGASSSGSTCPCVSAQDIGQAVADNSTCCPITVAEVCLANGHPGVIIRNDDGTLTRADVITGLTFADVDVVNCAPTINAQARLLTAAQVWTPGTDVVGTLTGLTVTGLTGTYNLVDQSGTAVGPLAAGVSINWNNDEEGPLQGPQSITAAAASTVLVAWTQR
ncbi:hypothetical protein AB0F17_28720 [Nonomuraea sp. NPDC026600]|uniref:hypothetical protein n=1 Tax=Nonomuraea sp. NPDC026600 TaxID=3155363 RepID=UPI0033F62856